MADEWNVLPECESLPSCETSPGTLIVPDTPPEVLARWEIERAVDCYHRSRNPRRSGSVDEVEVVEDTELPPPASYLDGSETQGPSQPCEDSESHPQAEGLVVADCDAPETRTPSFPFDASVPTSHGSANVEYTENEKAMLLILLPDMKDLL